MNQRYNFYNFEASFKEYLLAGNKNPVSVKNYLSDLRHFMGWFILYLQSNHVNPDSYRRQEDPAAITGLINEQTIDEYKKYLIENLIPIKTVNRRLSTMRKFCSFCVSQGWLEENPGKKIVNLGTSPKKQIDTAVIEEFTRDLKQQGYEQSTIGNYLKDIQDFLQV